MKFHNRALIAAALAGVFGLPSAAISGTFTVGDVTGQAGGQVVVPVSFEGDGIAVDFRMDFDFGGLTFVSGSSDLAADCFQRAAPNDNQVRVSGPTNPTNDPIVGEAVYCNFTFDIPASAVAGDTFALAIQAATTQCYDNIGDDYTCAALNDGSVTVTAEGPPTLTFDTTPVALPAGPYGSTQSGTIPANFTASTGAHSVDYTCTAPAGFTVTPATGSYDNDDTTATDLTVTATLTGAAQAGTVTCTVTPSDGSTPTTFDIDVSAPAGAETAPALTPTPANGGEVTVGGGAPGSNGTGTLTVTPEGGVGTDVAEVFCEADAPVSISPASLTFPVGSSAQGFTVTVPLTDAAQTFPGAITCWGEDGNGGFEWSFDVSAPAGVAAPTFIPATSLWSKFALIGVFAALGLLMVGLRRNH